MRGRRCHGGQGIPHAVDVVTIGGRLSKSGLGCGVTFPFSSAVGIRGRRRRRPNGAPRQARLTRSLSTASPARTRHVAERRVIQSRPLVPLVVGQPFKSRADVSAVRGSRPGISTASSRLNDVTRVFDAVLVGAMSRYEAIRCAMQSVGIGVEVGNDRVRTALTKLGMIDLRHGPYEPFLFNDDQIAEWRAEIAEG